jgi:DUF1680 family protein
MSDQFAAVRLSRRGFVAGLAGAAAASAHAQAAAEASCACPDQPRRKSTLPESLPFAEALDFRRLELAPRVRPFSLADVKLTGGPFAAAASWNLGYLKRLDPERLVHNFRVNARLPSGAKPLGGWEAPDVELRGHFTGHFLSAAALQCATAGDVQLRDRAQFMVEELAKCQRALGAGYLCAFPLEYWERLAAGTHVWAPFYTLHKIMAGLLDMHVHAGSQQALEVLLGLAGWVEGWTGSKSEPQMQAILLTEYGGMNETLYSLAAVTRDERWASVGDRFTKKTFFNPLALRRDELRGLHANTHIPQVIGAARRYELSSDARFRAVAEYFWQEITAARSYASGGTSNDEGWLTQPSMLAAELGRSVDTNECCCAYNMMKLTRHLYGWSADPRYFDYYERLLFNHRLGTIRPEQGHTQYYLSLTPGAWRTFCTEDQSFWCCTGTGVEEFSKLTDSIYWHDQRTLYVNLFIPSQLTWKERGLTLRQETRFPAEERTSLHVSIERPTELKICLRVPSWVAGSAIAKINGRALEASASPGSYLVVERTWRAGDTIELSLPMDLRAEALPDDRGLQAFLYGPVLLGGELGTEGLSPELITGPLGPRLVAPNPIAPRPAGAPAPVHDVTVPSLKADGPLQSWLHRADRPLEFASTGQQSDIALKPFNSIIDRRYSVYWRVA